MRPIRIAVVGVGKIARDQHLPTIAVNPDFELVAAVSRNAAVDGVPNFPDIDSLLEGVSELDAVALCVPPGPRHAMALRALDHGKHVLLEKPPGATVSELDDLIAEAAASAQADYVLMGAYGRGRLRETFGGVTKRLLSSSKLPLILGH